MVLAVAGLNPDDITHKTRRLAGGDWSGFSAAERAAFAFARKQAEDVSSVGEADLQHLKQHFGTERALDVIWWLGHCHYMTRVADAFQLPLEPDNVFTPDPGNVPNDTQRVQ